MLAPLSEPMLDGIAGLAHAVTTRAGGVSRAPFATLNVGLGSDDDPAHVRENRRRVAECLGFDALLTPYQVHGSAAAVVDETTSGRPRCDALITDRANVLVGVLGADCPGVLLVDVARHALAVVHAGWRGVAGGVIASAIDTLTSTFGSRAEDIRAWIGPGIGMQRYEVSDEVVEGVRTSLPAGIDLVEAGVVAPTRPGHAHLSLATAIRRQLVARGIAPEHVESTGMCTFDEPERFFSYRRDGPQTGRHALVAGWLA